MRPGRLTVEGFTSFRERVEVDFSALDLFAITGPTGAGKSSLVDAIVFALYGQVPRVGDDYKQLISHGADRLSVLLEFAVGGERYRVSRTTRRTGASQQRLERLRAGGWDPVADRVREIRGEVERALGLDYDAFTRSVVLPQGQFDAFLKGEPKERRKILVALLGLGVYERMLQIANQKAAAARAGAERIRTQLETDFAGATPEALARRQAELADAEAAARRAEAALAALAEGAALAQAARAARRETESARRDEEAEAKALAAAAATLEGKDAARAALEAEMEDVRQRLEASGFDEARLTQLAGAKPLAEQLAGLAPSIAAAAEAVAGKRRAESEARAGLVALEGVLPALEKAEAEARGEEGRARSEREAAHREHAALALRRSLRAGEPCPVCAQSVSRVPAGEAPVLEAVDERAREAEASARAAAARFQEERLRAGKLQAQAEALGREAAQLQEQEKEKSALAARLVADLRQDGFAEASPESGARVQAGMQAEIRELESARRARAELEARRQALERKRAGLEASLAAAAARGDAARGRIEALQARREDGAGRLDAARRDLLRLAAREGWAGLEAPVAGADEAEVVEALRQAAQRSSNAAAARVATLQQAVLAAEKGVVRVAELGAERASLEAGAALHKRLADLVRADELVAWIQEEALGRLAEEGSRHLARLSQGRYELRLGSGEEGSGAKAEQDFFVVDRWNADAVRSVRTLSGGETFLASLALALALAESLAELSSEGRASDTLESLFLDEGFGTLDAETLDVVVSAIEALQGGRRMVGIVTHVPELAERLPARVEVRRTGAVAAAVVVWSESRRSGVAAWVLALAAAWIALAALHYRARDADSRLYAEIAARMADAPAATWIAPDFPPGWYMEGPFREHPVGLFVPAASLARAGYPALQAVYALNALYQVLTIVLLQRLAATLVPQLQARALGWLVQLLPIAFTFRIRANHEQAVLLCLVAALYGTERARARPRWALLTVAGLVGLVLVKGVLGVFGPALCVLWLLARRWTVAPLTSDRAAWLGLAAGVAAMGATALVYEQLYRLAAAQPFWSFYLARQLGVAAAAGAGSGLVAKLGNLVWYLGRVLWFPFPWSLALAMAVWRSRRLGWRRGQRPVPGGAEAGALAGLSFAVAATLLYVVLFSLSDRRADRYIFPAYYIVGAAGGIAALRSSRALARLAGALDRPWVPAVVWAVAFAAHLFAGRLGVPTIKVWAS